MTFFEDEPETLEQSLEKIVRDNEISIAFAEPEEASRLKNQILSAKAELKTIRQEAKDTHEAWDKADPKSKEKKEALKTKQATRDILVATGDVPGENPETPTILNFQRLIELAEKRGITREAAYSIWHSMGHPEDAPFNWGILNTFEATIKRVAGEEEQEAPQAETGRTFRKVESEAIEPEPLLDPETGEVINSAEFLKYLGRGTGFQISGEEELNWYLRLRLHAAQEIAAIKKQFEAALKRPQREMANLDRLFLTDAETVAQNLCAADKKKSKVLPYATIKFISRGASWTIESEEALQAQIEALDASGKDRIGAKPKSWTRNLELLKKENESAFATKGSSPWLGMRREPACTKFYITHPEEK